MSKRLLIGLTFFLALFGIVSSGFAANSENLIIHNIESMVNDDGNSYRVKVLLSALNEQNLPITDLGKDDFILSEDDEPVDLESVEVMRDLPINVIVVMDISGSMQGERLRSAREAISQFVKSLYRGDKIAIFSFNAELQEIVPLTENLNQARDTFESAEIYAGGGTCLFDATYAMIEQAGELPPGRQAVVVLSDGWDTTNGSNTCSTHTVDDIIMLAGGSDLPIPIYTIGIGTDIDREALETIAGETGGVFAQSTINADLPQLFEQVANRLSSQYELIYISKGTQGEHTLTVNLDNISAERTYTLPGLPPVISIAYPEAGQALEPGKNRVVLSLVDRGIPVDSLAFMIDDLAIGVGGQVGDPPYEYEIDFSQYEGQEVELKVMALGKGGDPIAQTTMTMDFTTPVTEGDVPAGPDEEGAETSPQSNPCPPGSVCIGQLQLTKNQIVIIGAVLLVLVFAVILLVYFSKKKGKKEPDKQKKDSLFEDATLDGFALPTNSMGRLTILSSDDPLMVGKEFQLAKSPTMIGRSINNDIALPKDSAVSRKHIKIYENSGDIILAEIMKNLSDGTKQPPTYGTYINDRKVTDETVLHTGDEISLGRRTKLRYEGAGKESGIGDSEDVTMDEIHLPDFNQVDDATREG